MDVLHFVQKSLEKNVFRSRVPGRTLRRRRVVTDAEGDRTGNHAASWTGSTRLSLTPQIKVPARRSPLAAIGGGVIGPRLVMYRDNE